MWKSLTCSVEKVSGVTCTAIFFMKKWLSGFLSSSWDFFGWCVSVTHSLKAGGLHLMHKSSQLHSNSISHVMPEKTSWTSIILNNVLFKYMTLSVYCLTVFCVKLLELIGACQRLLHHHPWSTRVFWLDVIFLICARIAFDIRLNWTFVQIFIMPLQHWKSHLDGYGC